MISNLNASKDFNFLHIMLIWIVIISWGVDMETTVSKLERQIEERLKGVSEYESININHRLGKLLDSYDIPDVAKVACLTIDTSMRHLDDITYNHLSKHSILIEI